jgi:hypothetical protein
MAYDTLLQEARDGVAVITVKPATCPQRRQRSGRGGDACRPPTAS